MAIVLIITTDNEQPIELPILGKCSLGRSSSCDLVINDRQMSGKHGVFELNSAGQLLYSDLDSTNGSYLNNSRIQKIQFRIDEVLRLGNTTIIIDEKRLNSKERLSIGRGIANDEDSTLVMPPHKGTKSIVRGSEPIKNDEAKEPSQSKKSVVLNKDLKKKIPKSNWMGGKKDSVIEQEESSGKTKFLKLDINKHKKK